MMLRECQREEEGVERSIKGEATGKGTSNWERSEAE